MKSKIELKKKKRKKKRNGPWNMVLQCVIKLFADTTRGPMKSRESVKCLNQIVRN